MSALRLVRSLSQVGSKSRLRLVPLVEECSSWKCIMNRNKATQAKTDGFEDLDKPIKFTTSKAAEWTAQSTHGGSVNPDMPAIQPLVVSLSTAIFLLYFLALREESDIDEGMKVPLWEKIPGLEKQQLNLLLQYNKEHGLATKEIEDRLNQITKEEEMAVQQVK